jgi:hypothetical protein
MRRRFICLAAALVACGGSSTTPGPSTSSEPGPGPDGSPPPGDTAIAFTFTQKTCRVQGFDVSQTGLVIALADRVIANACSIIADTCVQYRDVQGTLLLVNNFDALGAAAAVGPGTYPVNVAPASLAGTFVFATAQRTDAACTATRSDARSGSLTLGAVSAGQVTGSYDLTLQDGSRTAGAFTATRCANTFAGGDDICSLSASSVACTAGTPSCR